jgi:hypothetical protein
MRRVEIPASPRDRLALLGALALALGLRVWHLLDQPSYPWFFRPRADAYFYHANATQLARGDWLLDGQVLHTSPGYSYFLGALYALAGDGPWAPRVVQLVLGLGLVALVWDTARRAFGVRIAWLPAFAAAAYGPLIWFEGHLLSDSLGAFAHALFLWQLVRVTTAARAGAASFALLGLVWGLACVVRPNALLLGAPAAYGVYAACAAEPSPKRFARAGAWVAAGALLAIAPVSLRNWIALGEPVLLSPHAGITLYVGNAPGATGTWHPTPEIPDSNGPRGIYAAFHASAERAVGRKLSLREADAFWVRSTLAYMAAEPLSTLRLLAHKSHLYWDGRELHDIYDYEFARTLSPVLGLPLLQFLVLAPFALVGTGVLLFRSRSERAIALTVLATMAAIVIMFVTNRYRLPVVAPALLAATGLVCAVQQAWREGARVRLAAIGLAFALACALAVPVAVNKRFERKYYGLGKAWLAQGRPERAQWAFERSLAVQSDYLPSREMLTGVLAERGDHQAALDSLARWRALAEARGDAASLARNAAFGEMLGAAP